MSPLMSLLLGVCVLLLSGLTVSAVSLEVRPNLQQFFSGASVTLSCVDHQAGGQTIKRTTGGHTGGQVDQCGSGGFGVFNGSFCSISLLAQSDTGVYWCETSSGQRSIQVNISVSLKDDPFILEIPVLPVMIGSDVTLCCRNKDGSSRVAYFLRNGVHVGDRVEAQELTIRGVQPSHEGLYSCSTDVFGASPQSWLRVRDPPIPLAPRPSVSVPRLFCHLLVVCLYCGCTVVMVTLCCNGSGCKPPVSVEVAQCVDEYDVITEL